jgi:hypothetical protein
MIDDWLGGSLGARRPRRATAGGRLLRKEKIHILEAFAAGNLLQSQMSGFVAFNHSSRENLLAKTLPNP